MARGDIVFRANTVVSNSAATKTGRSQKRLRWARGEGHGARKQPADVCGMQVSGIAQSFFFF